ncbi:hypothetical protein K443DRAFT_671106, partial [Laccaria amethystina LaAM-08-1]
MMPRRLALRLAFLTQEERDALYGSIVIAASSPYRSPTREGVIQAYDDVKKVMIVDTVVAVVPFVLSFFMPNWYLGTSQNALDQV